MWIYCLSRTPEGASNPKYSSEIPAFAIHKAIKNKVKEEREQNEQE